MLYFIRFRMFVLKERWCERRINEGHPDSYSSPSIVRAVK